MRHVREVLKLHRDGCMPMREIARMVGVPRSTVRDMIVRFDATGLPWPVPAGISDTELEGRLYARTGPKPAIRRKQHEYQTGRLSL